MRRFKVRWTLGLPASTGPLKTVPSPVRAATKGGEEMSHSYAPMKYVVLLFSGLFMLACGDTGTPTGALETTADALIEGNEVVDLTVSLELPEHGYQLKTEPTLVAAGTERDICSVVRVDGDGEGKLLWANEMESLISENSHHMNVLFGTFSFYDAVLGEDAFETELGIGLGTYDCADVSSLMEKALPIFPSQRTNQRITFPDGVGVPMLVPLVLIFNHHYVNTSHNDVLINAALNVYGMKEEDVEEVGFLIFDSDEDLNVPPYSQKSEAETCVMNRDLHIALVSTHNHEKTDCATLNAYDGETGEIEPTPFFVNKFWEWPPILHFDHDEYDLQAGDGIHYACHYTNDEDRTLHFGPSAADEMCVLAAVAYPAVQTKEEVKSAIETQDLFEILALADSMIAKCDEKLSVPSPWPMSDAANFDALQDPCEGYLQTESNTLW
jgi:hypothetical protein